MGLRGVTLHDIAEEVGVSAPTVSRVLNNKAEKHRISEETEDAVLEAAKKLKYKPNLRARGLRLQKTNTLGLVVPDVSNPFFASITKRVQKTAHELGYTVVVCNTDENIDMEVAQVNLLYRERVDGIIAMPVGSDYSHFADWVKRDIALVLLDRCFDAFEVDSVVVNNYKGAYEAIEHLILAGHERIAIIQGLVGTSTNDARVKGYRDALAANDIVVDGSMIVGGDFRQETGYMETKLLLNLDEPPTAIFLTSDLISLGALQAIDEEELSVPQDVSLIVFDDFEFAPFLKCPLTAVRQPKERMGEVAVKLLSDKLQGRVNNKPRRIVLQPELIVRESVAAPPRGSAAAASTATDGHSEVLIDGSR